MIKRSELKAMGKVIGLSIVIIFGMLGASLVFVPIAYEAYDNDQIDVNLYWLIWSVPILTIIAVLFGAYAHVNRPPQDEDDTSKT